MHSFVTSKNVKWCHLIWPTLYIRCNFCLNLPITHGDMKENVSGCFFSEHSVLIKC